MLTTFAVVAVLLAVAYLFAQIAYHAGLPSAAAIVLVGIAAGGMLPHAFQITLTPAILAVFLPALIFEGAWSMDARALRRAALAIAVLAVPGVLLTALIIAAAGTFVGGLTVSAAFALGAILSATDPVAVLSLFRNLNVPLDLLTIVEGESLANDGVAVALVQAAMTFAAPLGAPPLWNALGKVAYVSVGGALVGLAAAFVGTPLLKRGKTWLAMLTTLAVAYGAYAAATALGASGIFASAAAGIALPAVGLEKREERTIERAWDVIALLANDIVFLLTGLSLQLDRIFHEPALLGATLCAVVAGRIALAYGLVPLPRAKAAGLGWRHAIALAGVRGGLSLALALGLPQTFPGRPQIIDAVFAVVFVTLVLQGWTLAPLLRRIDLRRT